MRLSNTMGQVTISLPKKTHERVTGAAVEDNCDLAHELRALVDRGLRSRQTTRQLLEEVASAYQMRLQSEGKLNTSPEQVLNELNVLRDHVASELYG